MKTNKIRRHSPAVMIIHWLVAVSGFVLLFSGLGQLPMYKRYNVIKIPGLEWSGNFEITYAMHLIAAVFFGGAILFHVVYHWRRKEYGALPKKGDISESIHIIKAMLKGEKEPPHAKFLAEQRLAYAAIAIVSLVLLLTGIIKVYKNLGAITLPPAFINTVTLIHTAFTPIFFLLIVAHLAAFILKANRPLLPTMFSGYVDKEYADERHPLWEYEKEQPKSKEPEPIPTKSG